MNNRRNRTCWLGLCFLVLPLVALAQLDPEPRRLVQFGFNQPIEGRGPVAGYGFYYFNQPDFPATNLVFRAAVAPIYLDTELGFRGLLGPNTDLGLGLAGGGFAQSYSEVRGGTYYRDESFLGHGGELSLSLYHLFNPNQVVPLNLVVRASVTGAFYERDDPTAPNFKVPDNRAALTVRTGLRWGGEEPSLTEPLAMEISAWHEVRFRDGEQRYGFNGDRAIEETSHLLWGRALLKYTFENEHLFEVSVTGGISVNPDRFSAYRLGGMLPFVSEFPLNIPGYYYQELSAEQFVLFNGQYSFPLTVKRNLRLTFYGASANVDYLDGLEQPGHWNTGAGAGLSFISPTGTWMTTVIFAHGFDAIRNNDRGANQIGVMLQWDLEAKRHGKSRFFTPGVNPYRSRGGEHLFRD